LVGFQNNLVNGKVGESLISSWLRSRGHHVLPIYEIEKNQFKGPAVYASCGREIIAPDLLAIGKDVVWIEAKHKTAFTWHRISKRFVTGIDIHHYENYLEVSDLVEWPVWLLFLHKGGQAKDSPVSPSGLFGNDLQYLSENENHRHQNHGKSGMVYWSISSLKKLASYRDLVSTHNRYYGELNQKHGCFGMQMERQEALHGR
jgi:hypothetical protein